MTRFYCLAVSVVLMAPIAWALLTQAAQMVA